MTTERLFNHAHVVWQTPDDETAVSENAVAVHIDSAGTLCLEQDGHTIVLNRGSIRELTRAMKDAVARYEAEQ